MGQLQSINHIVVLMLENRSFDCLLGKLYPKSDTFEGLSGSEQNPDADGANPPHFPDVPTIFNRLEQAGIDSWKIYFHDFAQAHTLLQLFLLGSHFHSYGQFQADCSRRRQPL